MHRLICQESVPTWFYHPDSSFLELWHIKEVSRTCWWYSLNTSANGQYISIQCGFLWIQLHFAAGHPWTQILSQFLSSEPTLSWRIERIISGFKLKLVALVFQSHSEIMRSAHCSMQCVRSVFTASPADTISRGLSLLYHQNFGRVWSV